MNNCEDCWFLSAAGHLLTIFMWSFLYTMGSQRTCMDIEDLRERLSSAKINNDLEVCVRSQNFASWVVC